MMKLRKWSAAEDRLLVQNVEMFTNSGNVPDYRVIAKRIAHRSPKQCRERYENSLQPDVKRGEWCFDETLALARLMMVHGQNWAAIKDQLPTRTYNAVKKKGRKLLGEIVDRNSIPKGNSSKASNGWTASETAKLVEFHLDRSLSGAKRNDYLFLALSLRAGRSEAEIERQLLQSCDCQNCSTTREAVAQHTVLGASVAVSSKFKDRWSIWKSAQIVQSLENGDTERLCTKAARRGSTISTSSASTMASEESAPKRKRLENDRFEEAWNMHENVEFQVEDFPAGNVNGNEQEFSFPSLMIDIPAAESNFDSFSLFSGFSPKTPNFGEKTPLPSSNTNLKEFDLSFLLPL